MTMAKSNSNWCVDTNIGKTAVFLVPAAAPEQEYRFSTTLEKIGVEWDTVLKNNTTVLILSDPVEMTLPKYGTISLTKIRANVATDYHTVMQEMWVRTEYLVDIT